MQSLNGEAAQLLQISIDPNGVKGGHVIMCSAIFVACLSLFALLC